MTPGPPNSEALVDCELERFDPQQSEQVQAVVRAAQQSVQALTESECQTLRSIWALIAQSTSPIAISANNRQGDATLQRNLIRLIAASLIWYDDDLRGVLQCPPFSALTTNHLVKAFGWSPAQVCSLVDAPLALLLYGPNTWLTVQSICQQSGEQLEFRVLINDQQRIKTHTPLEAADWRIWVPTMPPGDPHTDRDQHAAISFYSLADYETYSHYHSEDPGALYSFYEAMALSECLLKVYAAVLSS